MLLNDYAEMVTAVRRSIERSRRVILMSQRLTAKTRKTSLYAEQATSNLLRIRIKARLASSRRAIELSRYRG